MNLTIKEIAKIAGISPSAVSKIINNYSDINPETKKRVLKIIEDYHYRPSYSAKSLASSKTNIIAVVYAGQVNAGFKHPFFIDVLNSFKKTMGKKGYDLMLFSNENFHSEKEDYLERCNHYNVDGCIIISGEGVEASIEAIDQSSIPSVGIDLVFNGPVSSYVMTNQRKISKIVVDFLYESDFREIAFLGGQLTSWISKERREGFLEAMEKKNLPIKEEWVITGDFLESSGYLNMKQLIEQNSVPEAIFASSDMMALGAMHAVRESGIDITDIAFVGVDDIPAALYAVPSLTTVKQDKEMIGKAVAEKLHAIIKTAEAQPPLILDPILIQRNSTRGIGKKKHL